MNPEIIFEWLDDDFEQLGLTEDGSIYWFDHVMGYWKPHSDPGKLRRPLAKLCAVLKAINS